MKQGVTKTQLAAVAALTALLGGVPAVQAQKATERFIPLGQSPGLSADHTDIAEIEAVAAGQGTITLKVAEAARHVTVTDRTSIWLDRTTTGQTILVGNFSNLQVGLRVEVKYESNDRRLPAEWIKIAPPAPE